MRNFRENALFNLFCLSSVTNLCSAALPSAWVLQQRYDCPPGTLYGGAPCPVAMSQPLGSNVLFTGMNQLLPSPVSVDSTRTDCDGGPIAVSTTDGVVYKAGQIFVVACSSRSGGLFVYANDVSGWQLRINMRTSLWDSANPLDWPIFALSNDGSFLASTDGFSNTVEVYDLDAFAGTFSNPDKYTFPNAGDKVVALAMSSNGEYIACTLADYSGVVLLRADAAGLISLVGTIPNPASNNHFGDALAFNDVGSVLVIGAPFAGNVHVYTNGGDFLGGINAWNAASPSVLSIGGAYGASVALSLDGLTLAVGSTHSTPVTEKVYVYSRESLSSAFDEPVLSSLRYATLTDSSNADVSSDKTPQVYLVNGNKLAVAVGATSLSAEGSLYVFNAVLPSASPSQTPSGTQTPSITATPSPTPSLTPSGTSTPSISDTPSPTPSVTQGISVSNTPTVSDTPSPTISTGATQSNSPTTSYTPSVTPTISLSPTNSPASATPSNSQSLVQSPVFTVSPMSPTSSVTPTLSEVSQTSTVSPTISGSATISESVTPTVSETCSPTISQSVTPTVSESATISVTSSMSVTPTVSFTSSVSFSAAVSVTATVSDSPTSSPSISESPTQSITPSQTPSQTPTGSISESPSASPSASDSPSGSPSASASASFGAIRGKGGLSDSETNANGSNGNSGFSPAVIGGIVTLIAVAVGATLFLALYFTRIGMRKKVVKSPSQQGARQTRDNLNFS